LGRREEEQHGEGQEAEKDSPQESFPA